MNSESKSKALYENLDTTFVNLWALLRNLSQRGFIGRVRVELKDYSADVFMTGSNTPLVHEIDHAAGTENLEEAALHRLVLRARETPGTISVFEGADQAVAVHSSSPLLPESAAIANEDSRTEAADVTATAIDYSQPAESEIKEGTGEEPVGFADRSGASAAASELTPNAVDDSEWLAIVTTSSELVGAVERAAVSAGFDFEELFRASRLQLADDYSFLDPMSSAFTYSDSAATLNDELPVATYVSGLSEALRRVVGTIAVGDRERRVRERVALELLTVARKRKDVLQRSGFSALLDRIAGTKVI